MIRSFKCKDTQALFNDRPVRPFQGIERAARRKLEMIEAAEGLKELRVPPGNRLEALRGDRKGQYRKGQYGIRINDRLRICFRWVDDGAEDVEIVDYH